MESSESFLTEVSAVESRLDRELWVVTSTDGTRFGGLIATFVSTASIVPGMPRVLVGIARHHRTWELIETSGAFALHLFGEQHLDWVVRFGLQSGRETDKFAGMVHRPGRSGSPILDGALAWLDCRVETKMETGDRTVYLAEVVGASLIQAGPCLTAKRMFALVSDEVRARLSEDRKRHAEVDARAIAAWRSEARSGGA